jgi:hypothetical protein
MANRSHDHFKAQEIDVDLPEELLGKRHPADKLAIVCATRPFCFVVIRTLAAIVVLITLFFALDAVTWFLAWAASNDVASYFFLPDEATEDDRQGLASWAHGFSYDLPRLISLVITLAVLVAVQLLATRGLPLGIEAMKSSIVKGLPWPGRWQLVARYARTLRPWLITTSTLPIAWIASKYWPESRIDWPWGGIDLYDVSAWFFVLVWAVWGAAYAGWKGGATLIEWLPSFVGVSRSDLQRARKRVEQQDREEADRRWPSKKELRLDAAMRVFTAPPPPLRRRHERRRRAWWTGTETSVEALATELVVQALIEARDLGLVSISNWHRRNPRVVASLPPEEQPRGLAARGDGGHREGLTPGRVVKGKLSDMLDPVYGADQYASVVTTALEDLDHCGVAMKNPVTDTWQLSAYRLDHAATALALAPSPTVEATDGPTLMPAEAGTRNRSGETLEPHVNGRKEQPVASARDLAALRRRVARKLRGKRTTQVEGEAEGSLRLMLFNAYQYWAERSEREKYELPGRWEDS